jgi:hypothetical protein
VAALCVAADGAAEVGHREAAEVLHALLEPYADHWAVDGIGAACLGAVSAYLADLTALLGRRDEAAELYTRAAEAHRGAGATALLERTRRRAAACEVATIAEPGIGRFRQQGEVWVLAYRGSTAQLRPAKGLYDLARLLAEPGRELHVLDLVTAAGERTASPEGLHQPGDAGALLDEQARASYRRRLVELESEVEERAGLDPAGAERARTERETLLEALAAAYGIGGRPRRLDDPVERARSTVTQRIRSSVRRIEAVHPALGAHLRNSVRTGTWCSYRPESPVVWEL